jgi:hypothetical protein
MLTILHHPDGTVLTQDELDRMTADAISHQNLRKKLWIDIAAGVAMNPNQDMRIEHMVGWADSALAEFDRRFGARP